MLDPVSGNEVICASAGDGEPGQVQHTMLHGAYDDHLRADDAHGAPGTPELCDSDDDDDDDAHVTHRAPKRVHTLVPLSTPATPMNCVTAVSADTPTRSASPEPESEPESRDPFAEPESRDPFGRSEDWHARIAQKRSRDMIAQAIELSPLVRADADAASADDVAGVSRLGDDFVSSITESLGIAYDLDLNLCAEAAREAPADAPMQSQSHGPLPPARAADAAGVSEARAQVVPSLSNKQALALAVPGLRLAVRLSRKRRAAHNKRFVAPRAVHEHLEAHECDAVQRVAAASDVLLFVRTCVCRATLDMPVLPADEWAAAPAATALGYVHEVARHAGATEVVAAHATTAGGAVELELTRGLHAVRVEATLSTGARMSVALVVHAVPPSWRWRAGGVEATA